MIGTVIGKRKLRATFDALNRRDIDTFLKNWSEDATFIYPGQIAPSGEHVGRAAIHEWFENLLAQFPELRFTVTSVSASRLFDMTGTNTVVAEWEMEATNRDGYTTRNTGVTSVTVRRGQAVRVKDYLFDTGEAWLRSWVAMTE